MSKIRRVGLTLMSFVVFCIAFAVASRTAVAQTYMITDLDPPGQTSRDVALGINNSGQVVGYSVTSRGQIRAFLYSNGRMRILGTLGGSTVTPSPSTTPVTWSVVHKLLTGKAVPSSTPVARL